MNAVAASAPSTRTRWVDRWTWALLILGSIALLGLSAYRAATLPFNHDEGLSFAIFAWEPGWRATANHHPLNTALMHWCSILFGNSELSLRLPNVLAHVMYLLCALALVTRMQNPGLRIAGFVLCNLNLFLVEFFIVARGYGLALGFEMLSLYLLVRAYGERQRHLRRDLYLSVAAGSLAVLSNFSFVNYYLPLLLVSGWLLLTDGSLRRVSRSQIPATLVLLSGSGVFLSYILSKLFKLQRTGMLYLGGHDSFVNDTVHSLVRCSLYSTMYSPAIAKTISTILIGGLSLLLLVGLRQLFLPKDAIVGLLALMLASAAALPVLEHHLFDALFPVHRAALYYVPLYALVLVYALDLLRGMRSHWWRSIVGPIVATATAVTVGWYFGRGLSARSVCAWWEDAHNREVLELIKRDRAQTLPMRSVKLRASWLMEPSLNFYRVTRKYTWLMRVTRKPPPRSETDYIYTYDSALSELPGHRDTRLASYPDIGTVLLRVNHADGP
ncbi:MAG: ArnT family glycosyltransferase [Gemmatimonadales bacterium]